MKISDEDVERIAKRVVELTKPTTVINQPIFRPGLPYWNPLPALPGQYTPGYMGPYVTC